MKRKAIEVQLDNLPDDPLPILRQALKDPSATVVYTAARRMKQREIRLDEARAAYLKSQSCRTRLALLEVIDDDPEVFVKALHDSDAELRALGALKLAQSGRADAAEQIVELLADRDRQCRVAAIRSLAFLGETLVLRLTALQDEELVGECLEGLLRVEGSRALSFARRFVRDPHFEAATLALGGSRLPEAVEILQEAWGSAVHRQRKQTLLIAFALARATDILQELSQEEWVRRFLEEQGLPVH